MIYHGKVAWVMDKILNYDTESGKLLNYTAKRNGMVSEEYFQYLGMDEGTESFVFLLIPC